MYRPSPTRAPLNSSCSRPTSRIRSNHQRLPRRLLVLYLRPRTTSQVLIRRPRTTFTSLIGKVHPKYLAWAVRLYLSILPNLLSARPVMLHCEPLIFGAPVCLRLTRVALTMSVDSLIQYQLSQSLSLRTATPPRLRLYQMMVLMVLLKPPTLMLNRAVMFCRSIPMPKHDENEKSLILRFPTHHS